MFVSRETKLYKWILKLKVTFSIVNGDLFSLMDSIKRIVKILIDKLFSRFLHKIIQMDFKVFFPPILFYE